MTKVKICGITSLRDAVTAIKLGADALGFVFYKKSPRYIIPEKAKRIIQALPTFISSVGVFVNEKASKVIKIAKYCALNTLQFSGDETPEYCKSFRGYKIIKAFRVKNKNSLKNIKQFQVDAYLFDAFQNNKFGGTGKIFNWTLVKPYLNLKKPIILSGGLKASNIQQAIREISPYALDISSGAEVSPGKKSARLLKQIFSSIKQINSNPQNSLR